VSQLAALGLRPTLKVLARFESVEDAQHFESKRVEDALNSGCALLNRKGSTRTNVGPAGVVAELPTGKLTLRQREVLATIHALTTEHGLPPTIREMGLALGINSTNGVNDHLNALHRLGAIARYETAARGNVITKVGLALLEPA
jgi:hypothetical protein